jgi:hypothetical protein
MFPRRTIQRLVDEAAAIMTGEQLRALVTRLNLKNRQVIEAIWELVWVTALARGGTVTHEPALPGATTFPDVHYKEGTIEFIADVATVSDEGYEENNPVDEFREALDRLYRKHKVVGGFGLSQLPAKHVGKYRDSKVKVMLPPVGEIPRFVRLNFEPMVREVAATPDKPASREVKMPGGGNVKFDYNPQPGTYNSGPGHLSFDVPYSLSRNPVANALKGKKSQLADTKFEGLKGVILCDGACSMMGRQLYSPDAFRLDDIVSDVMRQHTSLGFVFSIGVGTRTSFGAARTTYPFELGFWTQPGIPAGQVEALLDVLNTGLRQVPKVIRTPGNTLQLLKSHWPPATRHSDHYGCWCVTMGNLMQNTEITLSARTLTSLLGGEIPLQDFRDLHKIKGNIGATPVEPLQQVLDEGRALVGIRFEPRQGDDDDNVVLTFGQADPAKMKFRVPEKR